jgi:hypothetical protein
MVWEHAHPHQKAPYGMSQETWKIKQLASATFHGYIQEKTVNGARIENVTNGNRPTVDGMHFDAEGVDYVFANCRKCTLKNFTGNYKTGMDPGVKADDPDTPRLGRCGCVCCTECYLVSKSMNQNGNDWIACPACHFEKAQNKNEIFWILNGSFYERIS